MAVIGKKQLAQKLLFGCMFLFVFSPNVQLFALQQDVNEQEDLFDKSIEELMEIEVVSTATLTKTKPRLVPSAVTTITQEDIWSSGARSLYELLDIYVPNLLWMRHHWEPDVMGLRGILADRNDKFLLLVNGRVMNERTHFGAVSELDLVMLSDIHHIDIVRGPGSALYGPGAVSMVINIVTHSAKTFEGSEIITRLGVVEEFYSTEVKHGQKLDDGTDLFVYAGIGKYVGASKYDAPQIYPFTFPTVSDYSWGPPPPLAEQGPPVGGLPGDGITEGAPVTHIPLARDGGSARNRPPLKFYVQIQKDNWDIWARYTRGGKKFVWSTGSLARHPWGWADWNSVWGWHSNTQTVSNLPVNSPFYGYQQLTGYVGYKQEIDENLNVDYSFSYDMFDFERFADNRVTHAYREDEYQGKALLRWQRTENQKIALGAEISHLELGMKSPGWPEIDPNTWRFTENRNMRMPRWSTNLYSLLGEFQWNMNDKWTTFIGARLDDHTYTDVMFSPRAALVHTPTDKDTLKLMWSRSVRANFEEEMVAQKLFSDKNKSDPEVLDSIELRYERQHSKNLDFAASAYIHYNLQAIVWSETTSSSTLAGAQREYGFELEAAYHNDKTRFAISHGFTKLYDFYLASGQDTYITGDPYGYGDDLTNWSNNITKLTAQHKLDDKWTFDASLRVYWGFWGMKDYDEYYPFTSAGAADSGVGTTYNDGTTPYPTHHPVIADGWKRAYRGSYFLDLGLQYKPSKDMTINITGYNLLGVFNKDFNKRNYVETKGSGDFRSHAPAVGISLLYKF